MKPPMVLTLIVLLMLLAPGLALSRHPSTGTSWFYRFHVSEFFRGPRLQAIGVFSVPSFFPFFFTGSTASSPAWTNVCILSGFWMSTVSSSAVPQTAQVLQLRYGLRVLGVNAPTHSTFVVQLQSLRNISLDQGEDETVGLGKPALPRGNAITLQRMTRPYPASAVTNLYFVKNSANSGDKAGIVRSEWQVRNLFQVHFQSFRLRSSDGGNRGTSVDSRWSTTDQVVIAQA
jgi:hypothetical protein